MKEQKNNRIESKSKAKEKIRPDTMAHFKASLEKNRRLAELLGKS